MQKNHKHMLYQMHRAFQGAWFDAPTYDCAFTLDVGDDFYMFIMI